MVSLYDLLLLKHAFINVFINVTFVHTLTLFSFFSYQMLLRRNSREEMDLLPEKRWTKFAEFVKNTIKKLRTKFAEFVIIFFFKLHEVRRIRLCVFDVCCFGVFDAFDVYNVF